MRKTAPFFAGLWIASALALPAFTVALLFSIGVNSCKSSTSADAGMDAGASEVVSPSEAAGGGAPVDGGSAAD